MVDLHLTIPNSNKRSLLHDALTSLSAAATDITLDVTVVDNMSTDGSAEMVAQQFPEAGLVRRTEAHGSSANFNVGMRSAVARYVGVLHEDARPLPGALDALVHFLDGQPKAGGASPLIRFPNGALDRTTGRFPSIQENLLLQLPLMRVLPAHRHYHEEATAPFPVDWCSATCLIFRRQALRDSGLFDENFVIFYEEVDLFRRLAARGWEAWFVPDVTVIHAGGITRPQGPRSHDEEIRASAVASNFQRSKYLWFHKHRGYLAEVAVRATDAILATLKSLALFTAWAVYPPGRDKLMQRILVQRTALRQSMAGRSKMNDPSEAVLNGEASGD